MTENDSITVQQEIESMLEAIDAALAVKQRKIDDLQKQLNDSQKQLERAKKKRRHDRAFQDWLTIDWSE